MSDRKVDRSPLISSDEGIFWMIISGAGLDGVAMWSGLLAYLIGRKPLDGFHVVVLYANIYSVKRYKLQNHIQGPMDIHYLTAVFWSIAINFAHC